MKLHELEPSPGSHRPRKRVGRGPGSGHGKTSTRGQKGQRARTSVNVPKAFEGGQTRLTMRIPKWRGFKNKWKKTFAVVNLTRLNRFEEGTEVTPEQLLETGVIKDVGAGIKVLGSGDLKRKLTIHAHRFSAEAKKKIEAAGGTAAVIAVPPPIREKTKRAKNQPKRVIPAKPEESSEDESKGGGKAKPAKGDKSAKAPKAEKSGKTEKGEKGEKGEKAQKAPRVPKAEASEEDTSSEKPSRPEKGKKS
jgi:large subunit ribosomal protein L15